MIEELIRRNRSYRRFYEEVPVPCQTLRELVDAARLSPSGANRQPLKFILSCSPDRNALIFPHLRWAGYLREWTGPVKGERPAGYIVVLGDTAISRTFGVDHGIAAQSILLAATAQGLGGCMIGALDQQGLREALAIPEPLEILLVIALGKPKEEIVIDTVGEDGNIKYWREPNGTHHVPKRSLDEIIISE